jgi:tetratricopeptide (TPR) repeat protein
MATSVRTFQLLRHFPSARRLAAVLLVSVGAAVLSASHAAAQISAETLIGDAVSDPDNSRYSDVAEAIKRYSNKDVLGAKQFLESAKRKEDRLPPVNLMMAKLYFLSRQTQAGLAALEATAREVPDDPEPYLLLADQAIASQQAIQASALYDKAIALVDQYDENPRRKRKFVIRAYAGRSAVLQRWQDWEGAEADLRKWIEADPEEANAYNRLGFVLFMQGREKDGYDAFTKAKELNADLPSPYVSAASMYQRLANEATDDAKQQEYQSKAEQSFTRAYQADKNNATTLIAYSEYLIRTGQMDKAAQVLAAARQAQANSHQIQLLSGVHAQMTGDAAAAEKFYNQTLALAPGNRDANNQLALVLVESDDAETKARAEAIARLNAQLNPNNADVNITLAWVLRQVGKGAEANEAYQNGIKLGTLSADSTLLVSKLLVEQNRGDVARGLLENALEREQGIFVNRAEAEALLESLK